MKKNTILCFAFLFSFSMFANVSSSDKEVLVKLYKAMNGDGWINKWDLSSSVATWYGVKLQNDKVVSKNLSTNKQTGEKPAEIVKLKNLQELNLYKNKISGTIPSAIGDLSELRILNLSFNKLSGNIPNSVCKMVNLKSIELYMNALSGELPTQIGALNKLEILSVFNNGGFKL